VIKAMRMLRRTARDGKKSGGAGAYVTE